MYISEENDMNDNDDDNKEDESGDDDSFYPTVDMQIDQNEQ